MELHNAIGIDPDSRGCVACLVKRNGEKSIARTFTLTSHGREEIASFLARDPGTLIGIEGRRGQSSPLETMFERKGIKYYSIPAVKIGSYRTAMVGSQKNNRDDARAVAEFLLDLEAKGQLPSFAPPEKVDEELRILARDRLQIGQDLTVHFNRLWKAFKEGANDLYLALAGVDEEAIKMNLCSKRLLRLCVSFPDVSKWINLSETELKEISGGKEARGWETFVRIVKTKVDKPLGLAHQYAIKHTAENLLQLIEQKAELEAALEMLVAERPAVTALRDHYSGLGTFGASLIAEEVVTISRFKNDDRLASYSGLTKRDYSTGMNSTQRHPSSCNKRLKTAFISFARTYLLFNKGSHLEKYHQHLLKTGMSRMEALKRVARALVRDVYRFIKEQEKGTA
jgi:transposase